MKIPCAKRLTFIVTGLSFLLQELTKTQYANLTLIATALVLGSDFNLSEISRMWLNKRCVSTLSYFLSDAKFCTYEMMHLYALHVVHLYKIQSGYFLIDDTLQHHTKFCKWIHGVFVLFDHSLKVNLKATCIVFLYYSDGGLINFPISFRIFYKEESKMLWRRRNSIIHKTKYELAIEMLEWALQNEFPRCIVLADSWYGIEPFFKELRRLNLSYIVEIKSNLTVKVKCRYPKLTPTGRLSKIQHDMIPLEEFFESVSTVSQCGFAPDLENGKQEKILYHTKIVTHRLNAFSEKHRIVQSIDPATLTVKYLLSNQLTWESTKILSAYSYRWAIEEFFRNAKQLVDMEGATIRSQQGVTITLCLVSWIDFLLHFESYKQSTVEGFKKVSLTIPSIVRQAQYENLKAIAEKMKQEDFIKKWLDFLKGCIIKKRRYHSEFITIDKADIGQNNMDSYCQDGYC